MDDGVGMLPTQTSTLPTMILGNPRQVAANRLSKLNLVEIILSLPLDPG